MDLPVGTITFLFTDIEGSTRLWEEQTNTMEAALMHHDALIRSVVDEHGGYVFKTVGDAFCVAFSTAPDALEAAVSIQRGLRRAADDPRKGPELKIRMALHTGTAQQRDGDYYGAALNRVARLLTIGYGGQTLLSDVTRDLACDALPEHVTLKNLGEHRLKDLGRPEIVFQVCHPDLPEKFPRLKSLDNPKLRNNLPQQVTSFVGREQEMTELLQLLSTTRLLTITGVGGSGKTRLALQVAADLVDTEGDGVWLIELASLSEPGLVAQTIAQSLSIYEEPGCSALTALMQALKARKMLLVLDNCEHLIGACADVVASLLRSCPGLKVLATSQEALGIAGETVYRIPTLSLPDLRQQQTVEGLSQFQAVRLFIERAVAVLPSFSVTSQNAPALAELCHRLDGIPLAIELASARVRSLSVEEILVRLNDRFRFLRGGRREASPRQQTLQAAIDWSYDLLKERERALLRRLSIFVGGWSLAGAESVCAGDGIEDWEVIEVLTSLVDKSLVMVKLGEGTSRYRLTDTVRQYAHEKLKASEESENLQARHRAYYLQWAQQARQKLAGADEVVWLRQFDAEYDNLRLALTSYQETREEEAGLRLLGALQQYWLTRGYLVEGRERSSAFLSGAGSAESAAARAGTLNGAGRLAQMQGDYSAARAYYEEGLAQARSDGDERLCATLLDNLGNVAVYQGDYVLARSLFDQALQRMRKIGDRPGIALALGSLGWATMYQGDYTQALGLLEESLALRRTLKDKKSIASVLDDLGMVYMYLGDLPTARTRYEESLSLSRETAYKSGIAVTLADLGPLLCLQKDYSAGQECLAECLNICQELRDRRNAAFAIEGFGLIAIHQDNPRLAASLYGVAAAIREEIQCPVRPMDRKEYEERLAGLQRDLGDAHYYEALKAGRPLDFDQAIAFAFNALDVKHL